MGSKTRTGWARQRNGIWYVGFRLASDDAIAPNKVWEKRVPAPTDGSEINETYARFCMAKAVHEYSEGNWHPYPPADQVPETGGNPQSVYEYARLWASTQHYESASKDIARIKNHLAGSRLGKMDIKDVQPKDVAVFVTWLKSRPAMRGEKQDGKLAPRTIRNIYDAVRRAFGYAAFERIIPNNPCDDLPTGVLPSIQDKDESARDGWEFTRDEVSTLIFDGRIQAPRRVYYALCLLTGMRPGEAVVLRWRDWDRTVEPLTRLTVSRARKSVTKREGRTKTGARKVVPVHPALQLVLDDWWKSGWAEAMGKAPTADDLVVPNQLGNGRDIGRGNRDFGRDLAKLGLRARHQYVMRHTFITRAQDDGADGSVLRWATHAPPKSAFDGYTRTQWGRLCIEVAKLKVSKESWLQCWRDSGETAKTEESPRENRVGARGFEVPESHGTARNTPVLTVIESEPLERGGPFVGHLLEAPTSSEYYVPIDTFAAAEAALSTWYQRALREEMQAEGDKEYVNERAG